MKLIEYLNINCPLCIEGKSKRFIRHNFFENPITELHAYLLGLIMSDGSINDKRVTLSHTLSIEDSELLNYYKIISPQAYTQELEESTNYKPIRGRNVNTKKTIRLAISSSKLINDLHNLGVFQNKTYLEQHIPNQIPEKFIKDFIRGYFDGDGCFSGSVIQDKGKPNPRVRMQFQIDSKTKTILLEILEYLKKNNIELHLYECKRDQMFRIATHSIKECKKLYLFLYNNRHCYLKRKFNKFNYYVNTEVSQIITDHRNAQEVNVNESNNPPKSPGHPNSNEKDENVC